MATPDGLWQLIMGISAARDRAFLQIVLLNTIPPDESPIINRLRQDLA